MPSIDGLISGLDTTSIISSLMTLERKSGSYLTTGKTASQTMISTLQSLNSTLSSLQDAAKAFLTDAVTKTSAWSTTTSTSSQPGLAAVVSDGTALPGSTTFTVTSVASAGSAVSRGSVASLSTAVTSGPVVVGKGLGAIGASALLAGTHARGRRPHGHGHPGLGRGDPGRWPARRERDDRRARAPRSSSTSAPAPRRSASRPAPTPRPSSRPR